MKFNSIITFSLFLIISISNATAQEVFSSEKIKLLYVDSAQTIPVVDNEQNIHLFFVEDKTINHLKYDNQGNLILKTKYTKPQLSYPKIQGYSIDENNEIQLFFSNSKSNLFFQLSIDSNTEKTKTRTFSIKFKKEKFLGTIQHNNAIYILTYLKGTSIIKRYNLTENETQITEYDLSQERFYGRDNNVVKLSDIFKGKTAEVIVENIPSSIETASSKIKIYPKDNEILITLNHRKSASRIIQLKLSDNTSTISHFNILTQLFNTGGTYKSNSFVYQNRIFQFIISKKLIVLTNHDIESKALIKKYTITENQDIDIANSPIIQEGGLLPFGGTRELSKTRQFLRKLSKSDVGIVAYNINNRLNLDIGGIAEMKAGGAPMMGGMGMPIGSGLITNIAFNSVHAVYISYTSSRSVYINCLFNPDNFEHINGEVDKNIFDRIADRADYLKETKQVKNLKLETVFKYGDYFMHGYMDKKTGSHFLEQHKE